MELLKRIANCGVLTLLNDTSAGRFQSGTGNHTAGEKHKVLCSTKHCPREPGSLPAAICHLDCRSAWAVKAIPPTPTVKTSMSSTCTRCLQCPVQREASHTRPQRLCLCSSGLRTDLQPMCSGNLILRVLLSSLDVAKLASHRIIEEWVVPQGQKAISEQAVSSQTSKEIRNIPYM